MGAGERASLASSALQSVSESEQDAVAARVLYSVAVAVACAFVFCFGIDLVIVDPFAVAVAAAAASNCSFCVHDLLDHRNSKMTPVRDVSNNTAARLVPIRRVGFDGTTILNFQNWETETLQSGRTNASTI